MISSILIANRGEIACRIMRTAQHMGIRTIAVYSDADINALHVKQADEAWHLGPAPASESYLCGDKIIAIAKQVGADAIHPGYGFLSENPEFVAACQANDIIFVGPDAYAIEKMGSKSAAKAIMGQANIPLVPGYHGAEQSLDVLQQKADTIGYPLLIKAVAGGGGKGMRVVNKSTEFAHQLAGAQREGLSSFANDKVLLEKYLHQPRHVEVQVFCDRHGNGIYLGDRDCSAQRRHQKVIEEAPAPGLPPELRQAMGEAAVAAAKTIAYVGAGTVEFLLDNDGRFYFMEMNTRLQVEHPVTEMICGQDLVAWQINIANGKPLPLHQDQVQLRGHAVEARIYAEDPWQDFQPSTGTIQYLAQPDTSLEVRVDTGVIQGDTISPFYDPMIAKLVVFSGNNSTGNNDTENRRQALAKLSHNLLQYQVVGISTNIDFLYRLANLDDFIAGKLHTGIIEQHQEQLQTRPDLPTIECLALAGLIALRRSVQQASSLQASANTHVPFAMRLNQASKINLSFVIKGQETQEFHGDFTLGEPLQASILGPDNQTTQISFTDTTIDIGNTNAAGKTAIMLNNRLISCHYFRDGNSLHLFTSAGKIQVDIKQPSLDDYALTENPSLDNICSPMNGNLIACHVITGQHVKKGEPLLVVEAMKMEHTLYAPSDGEITEIYYAVGDMVAADVQLLYLHTNKTDGQETS